MPDSQEQLEHRRTEISPTRSPNSATCAPVRSRRPRGAAESPTAAAIDPVSRAMAQVPRLTYKVDGKTVTESLPSRAAMTKVKREVAEFRKFQQLCRDFVEVNTRLCRMRPVKEPGLTPQEKKRLKSFTKKSRAK